ncbi:phosphate propanoyltransferase [Paenibacillus andongensis]|uniref:phosphate propanoyltransferase n=1 Tax=Paenibacillus andongensis TaxID=2975482 RepID=UPI0021BBB00E|nr:phosphate propanoyltransferase [Paenibacillus andongensis]
MDPQMIKSIVDEVVLHLNQEEKSKPSVPIGVSARHAHLSKEHLAALFGNGYELTKKADLSQPGQFAANETVLIVGPRGSIERVRILGPVRGATQVEVSITDSVKLGVQAPLRESGDTQGSAPVTIVGPKGSIHVSEGLIIAHAHIHMTPEDAAQFGVENGEVVQVKTKGKRAVTFENVLIRVSERYKLEMHIDTDEANAALLKTGDNGNLIKLTDTKGLR